MTRKYILLIIIYMIYYQELVSKEFLIISVKLYAKRK